MSTLPVRRKIEVVIVHTAKNKVCLTKVDVGGGHSYYGLPGGGVESGDTDVDTAIKECLEEVGIRIKNVRPIGMSKFFPAIWVREGKANKWSGSEIVMVLADFDQLDDSLYDTEGDGVAWEWVSWSKAEQMSRLNTTGGFGEYRGDGIVRAHEVHRDGQSDHRAIYNKWR